MAKYAIGILVPSILLAMSACGGESADEGGATPGSGIGGSSAGMIAVGAKGGSAASSTASGQTGGSNSAVRGGSGGSSASSGQASTTANNGIDANCSTGSACTKNCATGQCNKCTCSGGELSCVYDCSDSGVPTTATSGSSRGVRTATDGSACGAGVYDGTQCTEASLVCSGTGQWADWSCQCLSQNGSLAWSCSSATTAATDCDAETVDGASCSTSGSTCNGTGQWLGWTCTCAGRNGRTTWSCTGGG